MRRQIVQEKGTSKREQDSHNSTSQPADQAESHANPLSKLIAAQPFFQGLSCSQVATLTDCAMEQHFQAGQVIFKEGEPANRFYLIVQGKVAIEIESKECGVIPIRTLQAGDDLGWSWLFPPYYLHFGARAVEPTRVIFFYGTRLRNRCDEDRNLGYELLKRIAKVVIDRLDAVRSQLSSECQ
jgi:CRP/FNR family transcriptional regulator, cyclic AMP receptor protein